MTLPSGAPRSTMPAVILRTLWEDDSLNRKVHAWETLGLDNALDVLDAMLAVIIRDARKIGQKKRLCSLKDLDKSALALGNACSYLLKE
ncbi:hypothetical protein [Erwinia sp. LJJL01]|uniref:hypothetical protein n=1 Tax=Erwinia TaxID=551 RepID=UPI0039AF2551|nr:hypothetical protein [Erwinia aphidicola]